MNSYYFTYSNATLFLFLVPFVLAFLFFLAGAVIRFVGKEEVFEGINELAWALSSALYVSGLLLLYADQLQALSLFFLYAPILPMITSAYGAITRKPHWGWRIGDFLALVLTLPFLQLSDISAVLTFIAFLYFFVHGIFSFFYAEERIRHTFNAYSIKSALDDLPQGLVIASGSGKLLYVNKAFLSLLEEFDIDPHQKEQRLFILLRWKSYRLVDEQSVILRFNSHYYLLRERVALSRREMTLSEVDTEVTLNEELKEANKSLQKEKEYLLATLDQMKGVSQYQEAQNLRVLVHDSFAEEVSLIHQVLINPKVNDLAPLKRLVRQGLDSYERSYNDIGEMQRFYGLLGVHFIPIGDFSRCPDKAAALALIREATDNAIRHGNASELTLRSSVGGGYFHLEITNNGTQPRNASPHNGLAFMKDLFEKKGGSLTLSFLPNFVVSATLPMTKTRMPHDF